MYNVIFMYQDNQGIKQIVSFISNYKTHQKNVNYAKNYCKDKGIFLEIISIK